MRREPTLGLDGKHWWAFSLHIFKNVEGSHVFKDVDVIPNNDSLFYELKSMQGRALCGMECERYCRDDNKEREQIIAEEHRCYRAGNRDNTKRPIPIGTLGIMVVFSPFPF